MYTNRVITAYVGENDVERLAAATRAVTGFVAQYGDMAVERLDAEDAPYDRLVSAVQSIPFLVERKLVVIQSGSLNKDFTERFEEFISAVAESTDVVLTEAKIDKRTSYYKQLQKQTDFHEFKMLDRQGLVQFVQRYTVEIGAHISAADARFLVERCPENQLFVQHEIDKLALYDPKITRQTIELLTDRTPQSKIFDLLDAAFAGNSARTQELYQDQRAQQVEAQQILALLAWQLHIVAVVKAGQGKTVSDIASTARLKPYVIEKSQKITRGLSMSRLRGMVRELRELDVRSKTEGIILDEALQNYLLSLTTSS